MANRTVAVALKAEISQYVAGMAQAAVATKGVGTSAEDSGKKAKQHFDLAGKSALLMGGAVVAGIGMAVSKSMEFEKSLSGISAATGASGAALGKFRDAAMKAGADTQYSATEAADAITEMAKAGVSSADILGGGLSGALALAAAGQLDVADAAGIASVAMTQFSLSGNDLPHVADLLAAGAGKAMGSVEDLGAALNQSGLIASAAGLSIEETTGTLAAFANAGLIGSDAGTSLKTALQAIQAPSGKAAELMDQLGLNMYDAQGNMLGASEIAGQLQEHLGGLTQEQRNAALATIFGSDAVRAANVLYKEGQAGIQGWIDKTNDAGYAQEQAAALTDNLSGDIERLGGSFDTLMISIGQGAQGPLRELVQMFGGVLDGATGLIGVFGDLPGSMQLAIGAFGLWAVAGDKVSGTFGTMRTKIQAFREEQELQQALFAAQTTDISGADRALGGLGNTVERTGQKFGMAKAAIGGFAQAIGPQLGVAAAIYLISDLASSISRVASAGDEAATEIDGLRDAIDSTEGNEPRFSTVNSGLDDLKTKAADAKAILDGFQNQNWFDKNIWQNPFADQSGVIDAKKNYEALQTEIERLEGAQERYGKNVEVLGARYGITKDQVIEFADAHAIDLSGALDGTQWAFGRLVSSTGAFATEIAALPGAIQSPYDSLGTYASALGLSDDATKLLIDETSKLGESLAAFVDPLGTYTGLLQQKAQAEADAANATAEKTGAQTKSWEDFKDNVHVTFDEYMADLETQVAAQTDWQSNMLRLAGRVSQGTLDELARMGPEGAPLVADLVNRSDEELDRFDDVTASRSREATDAWGAQLKLAAPVLSAISKTAGQGVVDSLVAQLQAGTITVGQIAAQYGVNLAGGINPVLTALGKPAILGTRAVNGRAVLNADGNLYEDHQAEIAAGGAWRVWAEPETGGEAYIPLSASKRDRSMNIWRETGKRLGAPEAQYFASGGFFTSADVPRPSSTAPFGSPLSTGADATMAKEYDEVRAFLDANGGVAGGGAAGPAGSGGGMFGTWTSIAGIVQRAIPQARINSTYRPGDPGYHGKNKAVDFGFGGVPGGNGSAGLASIARFLYRGYGRSLAEIIYDGIGDDTPDVKNGQDHVYNAATRAEHHNHVHAAVYDQGGILPHGGVGVNLSGSPERVLNPRETVAYNSREFSGGGGSFTSGGVTVNLEGATISGTFDMGSDGLVRLVDGRVDSALATVVTGAQRR